MQVSASSDVRSPREAIDSFLARLRRDATLAVGVSGGSDSVGLLILLDEAVARPEYRHIRLVAVTIDHGLRAESADEAQMVAQLCAELSVPHQILRWDGDKPTNGISAAAREARYRLLMDAADTAGADAILTAHTFEDQAETVAMRAARSDVAANLGLSGMAEAVLIDRRRWLLRPLLTTRREAVRDFLRERGRGWIDDPTNIDPHYERVRVRQSLASASLSSGSAITPSDIRMAGEARLRVCEQAAEIVRRHLSVHHGVLAQLSIEALAGEPQAVRHVLGTLAAILGGRTHLPAAATMDRVVAMLGSNRLGRTTAGRVIFDLRRDALFMHREARDLPSAHLPAGQVISWDGRHSLTNLSDQELLVGPTPGDRDEAKMLFPDCPPAVAMRAMGVMPHVEALSTTDFSADKASVIACRILAPFDRFLPQFELSLAGELARLFECDAIPVAPINVFERKI